MTSPPSEIALTIARFASALYPAQADGVSALGKVRLVCRGFYAEARLPSKAVRVRYGPALEKLFRCVIDHYNIMKKADKFNALRFGQIYLLQVESEYFWESMDSDIATTAITHMHNLTELNLVWAGAQGLGELCRVKAIASWWSKVTKTMVRDGRGRSRRGGLRKLRMEVYLGDAWQIYPWNNNDWPIIVSTFGRLRAIDLQSAFYMCPDVNDIHQDDDDSDFDSDEIADVVNQPSPMFPALSHRLGWEYAVVDSSSKYLPSLRRIRMHYGKMGNRYLWDKDDAGYAGVRALWKRGRSSSENKELTIWRRVNEERPLGLSVTCEQYDMLPTLNMHKANAWPRIIRDYQGGYVKDPDDSGAEDELDIPEAYVNWTEF
ncbi:hypothetical protein FA95DRAFT_1613176 [Auriscalpium vulgare]|uniref:Uncharacterized protein n=1 Tax=Auriscalpium vulgare TaxID=40419 RepID=A0ACB8R563_9AGAM|nr:hypothetical protein FA95DRAFT_1613176 [Auriscalpium vulgare]